MQIIDLVKVESGTPSLAMNISHSAPTSIKIELTAADGTTYLVKSQSASTIPTTYSLSGLSSAWLTGRYQLSVVDYTEGGSGSVNSWSINL